MKSKIRFIPLLLTIALIACGNQNKTFNFDKVTFFGVKKIENEFVIYQDCNNGISRINITNNEITDNSGVEINKFIILDKKIRQDNAHFSTSFQSNKRITAEFIIKKEGKFWNINNKLYIDSLSSKSVRFLKKPKCSECFTPEECNSKRPSSSSLENNLVKPIEKSEISNTKYLFHSNVLNSENKQWINDVDYLVDFKEGNKVSFRGEGTQVFFDINGIYKIDKKGVVNIYFESLNDGGYKFFEQTESPILKVVKREKGVYYISSNEISYQGKNNNLIPLKKQ